MSDDNRTLSYLIFCFRLFPIPFVAMTILLNTKIKNGKKDNSPSSGSTGKPALDAQNDGCRDSDFHYKDSDDECPGDEIMCFDIHPPIYMRYCHSPTHPAVCPNWDDRAKDRDSECATGEIMCHYESDTINTFYCHKY